MECSETRLSESHKNQLYIDGEVLFLGIHSSFDSLKFTKFCHGFVNISNKIGVMQKVFFVEWYNSLLTSFRAKGIYH